MHTQNTAHLQSQLANDPEMAELLDLFLSELPKRVEVVMHAVRARELHTLRRVAHQMKGSCAGYGFPTIGAAAGTIEQNLDQGAPLEQIKGQVDELVNLCQRALKSHKAAA